MPIEWNGEPLLTTRKFSQYHDTTEFFVLVNEGIYERVAPFYEKGWSLRDIRDHTGIAKTSIRKSLIANGVCLRGNTKTPKTNLKIGVGKKSARPPYGFCYFQGKIVPDPREHKILTTIHRHWQIDLNANAIFKLLNSQKVPSRMAKEWSWNAVQNILERLNKKIIIKTKEGNLEIRKFT